MTAPPHCVRVAGRLIHGDGVNVSEYCVYVRA